MRFLFHRFMHAALPACLRMPLSTFCCLFPLPHIPHAFLLSL
jgi:hypothetical protein